MATERFGWGVIGCGWVARDFVVPAIHASSNGRLTAVCDRDLEAMAVLPELAGSSHRQYTDISQLLADQDVAGVYVATPNNTHSEIVVRCAAAGKHVLCEKPLAPTLSEAESMVAACEEAKVTYATAFDQRFHAAHRRLRSLVRDGELGEVSQVRLHYACWLPAHWCTNNWRINPEAAGGVRGST